MRYGARVRNRARDATAAQASEGGLQAVADLDGIRRFLPAPVPWRWLICPWMPLYLGLIYLLHPWLGFLALGGGAVLFALAVLTELRSRAWTKAASASALARRQFVEAGRRNAEVVSARNAAALTNLWSRLDEAHLRNELVATTSPAAAGRCRGFCVRSCSPRLGIGAYRDRWSDDGRCHGRGLHPDQPCPVPGREVDRELERLRVDAPECPPACSVTGLYAADRDEGFELPPPAKTLSSIAFGCRRRARTGRS